MYKVFAVEAKFKLYEDVAFNVELQRFPHLARTQFQSKIGLDSKKELLMQQLNGEGRLVLDYFSELSGDLLHN